MEPVAAAQTYVRDKLGVDFVQDKSELLKKIIRAFFAKVPFQNVSTSILPAGERFPNEQDVIENGKSLKGGMNVHNNWFFKILLETLGYKVEYLAASVKNPASSSPRKLGSHFAILVKDLKRPGDLHLVDVGSGYPVFKPIPLDHLPFTTTDVTVTYRFVDEDGQWHNEHKDSNDNSWKRFASYDKTPINKSPAEVFRAPVLDFLQEDWLIDGFIAVQYPEPRSTAIPDIPDFNKDSDYIIRIKNNVISFKNSNGSHWDERILQDQMVQTFQEYFPNIPKIDVEKKVKIVSEKPASPKY